MLSETTTQTQTEYSTSTAVNIKKEAPASAKTSRLTSEKSLVGDFSWSDVLIPKTAGHGTTRTYYQYRTLIQYAALYGIGIYINQTAQSPGVRAAALGFLFPGAGLTAVGSLPSLAVFVVSTCCIPLALFAWFGCGGVFFPIFLWTGTAALSAYLAHDTIFEFPTYFWAVACVLGIGYVAVRTISANAASSKRRVERNDYLIQDVQVNQSRGTVAKPGSRELDLQTLRFVQWFIELGLADKNDWTYHDIIDQFQTAALRYQLYETVYSLGFYQAHYAPGFHGYLSQAQRNVIRKSCTKKVMNYWKWESILGKFNFLDWNPIKKDNVMVTGYILEAIGIYRANTGDTVFEEKDSLEFVVTENSRFKTNFQGLSDAVFENMTQNPYCLYPCEPNWHYTICNLVAIGGVVLADRILGRNHGDLLKARFERNLEEEFTKPDGSILPIQSELTGFTIPGLCGVLTDCINSMLCAAYLPHIAHRNWALARRNCIKYDENGKLTMINLTGADRMDPGNYKPSEGYIRAIFAAAAAEFGDEKIRKDLLEQLDSEHPIVASATGALRNKGLSTSAQSTAMRARIGRFQDWTNMLRVGPPEHALRGPLLVDAKFPDVLVAKAYSQDGESLELVLYNGKAPGDFELGFERLAPGKEYFGQDGKKFTASAEGKATINAKIDGRTQINVSLA